MMVIVLAGAGLVAAQRPASSRSVVRFAAVDVYIDATDQALAAYQFELAAEVGEIAIVGIEGGEHPAFAEPPYYDPAALSQKRVIIAAFNTAADLPRGKTRVARVHVQIRGAGDPEYAAKLVVAASGDGKEIPATITLAQGAAK